MTLSSTALGLVGLLLRMEGMPHSKAADLYEGRYGSIMCQHKETLLFEIKAVSPRVQLWEQKGKQRRKRAAVVWENAARLLDQGGHEWHAPGTDGKIDQEVREMC